MFMMRANRDERTVESNGDGISRRSVLRTVGAGAVAGTGLVAATGTASAHKIYEAVFCGCSQVCACGHGKVEVLVYEESNGSYDCNWVAPIDNTDQGDEESFSFCYELDESEDNKKIIAVRNDDDEYPNTLCNPNDACAGQALEECDVSCQNDGQQGGPCGDAFLRTCGEDDDHPGQGQGPPDENPGRERGRN